MSEADVTCALDHEADYREWLTQCPVNAVGNEQRLREAYTELLASKPGLLPFGSAHGRLFKLLRGRAT